MCMKQDAMCLCLCLWLCTSLGLCSGDTFTKYVFLFALAADCRPTGGKLKVRCQM